MRAVVLKQFEKPWSMETVPDPKPAAGQVLIRIHASGMCGTDVHVHHGHLPVELPKVLGHEPVGEIVALGAGVLGFRVGDRVGVSWHQRGEGRCRFCQEGRFRYCAEAQTWAHLGGGNGELMLAWATGCTLVPPGLDDAAAAPIFCAGYTVFSGLRNAAPRPGERVAVLGIGGLGHLAIQYARIAGATVVAVDVTDEKLELAKDLGAEYVVNPRQQDPAEYIHRLGGADQAIAVAVAQRSFEQAFHSLRRGGRLVFVALPPEDSVRLPIHETVMNGISIVGSVVGNRAELAEVYELHRRGRTRVIYQTRKLEEVNEAFEQVESLKIPARVVLTF
jgi:propanol-preferring alcohol dehydrogenase